MDTIKRFLLGLLLLPLLIAPLNAQINQPIIGPIIYDTVWGITTHAGMFEALTFNLTNTADLETWQTEYAPNDPFERIGNIGVFDFEAILQTGIPTDVAAFYGGRRVTNKCLWSQDISNAAWDNSNSILYCTDGFIATAQYGRVYQVLPTIEGRSYTLSFTASVPAGARATDINFYHGNSESGNDTALPITTLSTRYSTTVLGKVGDGDIYFGIRDWNTSSWVQVTITNFQVEEVTGQTTNQNPSNHIPTTTTAVTKFYNTENGNTVTDNVVTETEGDEIESVIGWAAWLSTTNVIGASVFRDFTHADWNKVNGSITPGDVVLIDGTTVADKNTFTASAANATIILNPYISASGVHAGGVFVKRKTGTGTIEVTIDGGTTWVDKTSEIDSALKYYLAETTLATVTDPEFGIRLVGSGDAVYLDWCQVDDGYPRVSAHPIGGGETLGAQSLIAADAAHASKLIKDKQGYVVAEVMLMPDDESARYGQIVNNGTSFLGNGNYLNSCLSNDGTTSLTLNNAFIGYTKAASYWGHEVGKKQLSSNGISSSVGAYDGSWGTDSIQIGRVSTYYWAGIISKITFGVGIKTTQAEMEEETATRCYVPIGSELVRDSNGEISYDESGDCIWAPR